MLKTKTHLNNFGNEISLEKNIHKLSKILINHLYYLRGTNFTSLLKTHEIYYIQ